MGSDGLTPPDVPEKTEGARALSEALSLADDYGVAEEILEPARAELRRLRERVAVAEAEKERLREFILGVRNFGLRLEIRYPNAANSIVKDCDEILNPAALRETEAKEGK